MNELQDFVNHLGAYNGERKRSAPLIALFSSSVQKKCMRRAGSQIITAKIELKPPPYPLNRRPDYISTFMEKLVSWEAVSSRLKIAKSWSAERDREAERRRKEEEDEILAGSEATETYLRSETEDSEAE